MTSTTKALGWLRAVRILVSARGLRLRAGEFLAVRTPMAWELIGVDFDSGQPIHLLDVPANEAAEAIKQLNAA